MFSENTYYYDIDYSPWFYDYPYNVKFSNELACLYSGGCVTYSMIQSAACIGYNEIYLIGVDFIYPSMVYHDGTVKENNVDGHFYDDGKPFSAHYDRMISGFMCAKQYAESHNIKIYNATRGGALEVFERVALDELLEN